MPLVNTVDLLKAAREGRYCVGAFNMVDYLTMEATIRAAEAKKAPVIVQTSSGVVKRFGPAIIANMVRPLAERASVPVALHLDHGTDRNMIHEAIVGGYTSVMIDASKYAFEENVARTLDVVQEAHANGVSVEAEIGVVAGVEDDLTISMDKAIYTTPEEAMRFAEGAKSDFLAVAIGTAHGLYKVKPRLDIEALRAIRAQAEFPLVIHGGTGLSFETLQQLVAAGAAKLNVSTQLKMTYIDALYGYIGEHREEYNPTKVLDCATNKLIEMIGEIITVLGGENKA